MKQGRPGPGKPCGAHQSGISAFLPASVCSLLFVGAAALFLMQQQDAFLQETVRAANSLARLIAQDSELPIATGDGAELENVTGRALSVDGVLYVSILRPDGKELFRAVREGVSPNDFPPAGLAAPPVGVCRKASVTGKTYVEGFAAVAPAEKNAVFDWEGKREQAGIMGTVRLGLSADSQSRRFRSQAMLWLLLVMVGFACAVTVHDTHLKRVWRAAQNTSAK